MGAVMAADRGMTALLALVSLFMVLLAGFRAVGAQSEYTETCSARAPACTSRVAHFANGNQSLVNIAELYTVTVPELLGTNNLDLTEASVTTKLVPYKKLVLIPLLCDCINASRRTNKTVYTIQAGDTLSHVAEVHYGRLVTYQEIAEANNIPDPDKIDVGQKFVIPFPCACRNSTFSGSTAVFLTYTIQMGDDLSAIAATYGRTVDDLADFNNIQNVTAIAAGYRLQIPLAACSSSFNSRAVDYGLLVTNGSYSLSPGQGCVLSSCYGNPLLELHSTVAPQSLSRNATCPKLACNNSLAIGNLTTSPAGTNLCTVTSCLYDGYVNSTTILNRLQETNETTCPAEPVAPSQQQVETTPSPPTGVAPAPPPPSPNNSKGIATVSSLVIWRNIGLSLSICIPVLRFLTAF